MQSRIYSYCRVFYKNNKKPQFHIIVMVLWKSSSCLQLQVSTPQQDIEDAEETANNSASEEKSAEEGLFDMVGYLVLLIFFDKIITSEVAMN